MSLEHALSAADAGFRVVPLPPGSKRPALNDWPNLATSDPEQIRRWFADAPESNYGLAMGAGLLAIDVDVKGADGKASLIDLVREVGGLPKTLVHGTPSGGMHAIYRVPQGVALPNAVGIVPGVDLRSDGGQIVGPGSTTSAGAYSVLQCAPIADLPAAWIEYFKTGRRSYASPVDEFDHELLVDGRKAWLLRLVWRLRKTGLGEAAIVAAATAEAERRIADAHRYGDEIRRLARNVIRRASEDDDGLGLSGDDLRAFRALERGDELPEPEPEQPWLRSLRSLRNDPPPEPLIGPWLPQGSFALLYGAEHTGKSLIAMDWALTVASGVKWAGFDVEGGQVIYILAEGRMQERAESWHAGRGMAEFGEELDSLPLWVRDAGFSFGSEDDIAALEAQAAEMQPALIVVDTLARTLGGPENDDESMSRVIEAQGRIRRASPKTALLLVCHSGKDDSKGVRGHSSLPAAADVRILVKGGRSDRAAGDTPPGTATGGWVAMFSEKSKDGGTPKPVGFDLVAEGSSVWLRQKPPGAPLVPKSRQGGAGRQQDGLSGWQDS